MIAGTHHDNDVEFEKALEDEDSSNTQSNLAEFYQSSNLVSTASTYLYFDCWNQKHPAALTVSSAAR